MLLDSSDLSEFKKYSIVYNPKEKKKGQRADDAVKYIRPCYVKSFVDNVIKVEVVSRHQIIIQTVYEVFLYRSDGNNQQTFG